MCRASYRPAREPYVPHIFPGTRTTTRSVGRYLTTVPGRFELASPGLGLATHLLDLGTQHLVFARLDAQKLQREARFLFDSTRRQQIHIAGAVLAAFETRGL